MIKSITMYSVICDRCGKPANYQTRGWIENICKKCYRTQYKDKEEPRYPIKLDLTPIKLRYMDDRFVEIKQDFTETWQRYLKEIEK